MQGFSLIARGRLYGAKGKTRMPSEQPPPADSLSRSQAVPTPSEGDVNAELFQPAGYDGAVKTEGLQKGPLPQLNTESKALRGSGSRGDKDLEEVLKILNNTEELHVSEPAVTSALLVLRRSYPHVNVLEAAAVVASWASSPTFDGTNASALLLTAGKKQPLSTQRKTQNAPQRQNPYELRTCERCDLDFGVRKNGALARKQPFLCCDCQILEARWAA